MSGPVETSTATITIQPVGLPGRNGSSFTATATPPDNNTGIYNDIHCDLSTGDMYKRELTGWVKLPYKFEGASAYDLAVGQGYEGSLEDWLLDLVGAKGDRGDKTELRVSDGYIQWKYTEEPTWTNLIAIADLKGDKGDRGSSVELQISATHIQWRVEGTTDWLDLVPLEEITGPKGPAIELQKSDTHIQWRVVGDTAWIDLVPLTELVGAQGNSVEMQKTATHIQWRVVGEAAWKDLVPLTDITGPRGPAVEMQVTDTHIQWREEGTDTWNNLIPVETLIGATGASIDMQVSATHIQWKVHGTDTWIDLIPLSELKGPTGDITPELEQLRTDTRGYKDLAEAAKENSTTEADRAKDEADRAEQAAGTLANSVTYETQTGKTDQEKLTARKNIGANDASNLTEGTIATSVFADSSHGERSGGLLHALATEALAGFMSPAFVKQLTEYAAGGVVLSVNGEGGEVVLNAKKVGAVPLTGSSDDYVVTGTVGAGSASMMIGGAAGNGVAFQTAEAQSSFNLAAIDAVTGINYVALGTVYSSGDASKRGYQLQVMEGDANDVTEATFKFFASGNLEITGTPTATNHAVTKGFVDNALGAKQNSSQKNQANGYAGLDAEGLIFSDQLPGIAITDIAVVPDKDAMLALDFQVGDLAIREDLGATFALQAMPPSVEGNWKELLSRAGGVLSVGLTVPAGFTAGAPVTSTGNVSFAYAQGYQGYTTAEATKLAGIQAGADKTSLENVTTALRTAALAASVNEANDRLAITDAVSATTRKLAWGSVKTWIKGWIGKGDVGLSDVDNTSDAAKPVSTATQSALDGKVGKSGNQSIAGALIVNDNMRVRSTGTSHVRLESETGAEKAIFYVTGIGAEAVIRIAETQSFLFKPDGTFHAPNNVSITSDARLKRHIRPIRHATDRIRNIKGYTYVKDGKRQYGFLAQELLDHFPEAVNESRDENDPFLRNGEKHGTLSVNADNTIVSVLVQALNETLEKVDKLQERVKELERNNGAS